MNQFLTVMSCLKMGARVSGTRYSIHLPHGFSTCDSRKGEGFSSPHTCDLRLKLYSWPTELNFTMTFTVNLLVNMADSCIQLD